LYCWLLQQSADYAHVSICVVLYMRIESVLSSGSVSRRSTAHAEMPGVSAARGTQASDIGRGNGARAWRERNEGRCFCDKWKPVRVVLLSTAGRDPVCSDGLNMSRALAAEVCGRCEGRHSSRAAIPPWWAGG
jgi:hypothetical protein